MEINEKNTFYKYLPLNLALLIPFPGRFVYGLIIMLEMLLITLTGTLVNALVNKLKLKELKTVIILLTMIATTILFRQILVVTYTEIALTLGYLIYLPPVSLFLIQVIYSDLENPLAKRLKTNIIQTLLFSLNALFLFLFRDLAGFGTFTFFSKNHMIYEKVLFDSDTVGIFSFFATLPGVMIITACLLFLNIFTHEKIKILKRVEKQNDIY
ncbi:MAG: hypothetical protein K5681_08825 [Treponema sp.]|nr:hypothetical protein [Treponema sp.]